ncbi:hypothetical protein REMIM1_PE00391 (plasmid) [Rhizobium etli bv. mimosae str. Mim1]|nr:hypothetical protein REMIM1_PE00391 [Rhizobium etli bv. mimosae str. Mim1]
MTNTHSRTVRQPVQRSRRTPCSIIESTSLILMRELLSQTDHLGISILQAQAELTRGLLKQLPIDLRHTARSC